MDYDGTLSANGTVDHDLIKLIQSARSKGIKVVIASGRPLDRLPVDLVRAADAVCCEGGGVISVGNTVQVIADERWLRFLDALERSNIPHARGKVAVLVDAPHLEPTLSLAREVGAPFRTELYKDYFFILPETVSKLAAVQRLLQLLDVDGNALVVGDELNDLELMKWARWSAAVKNAREEVKAVATVVLDRDDGEGVKDCIAAIIESQTGTNGLAGKAANPRRANEAFTPHLSGNGIPRGFLKSFLRNANRLQNKTQRRPKKHLGFRG